jgi:hypothetical protein
MLVHGPYEGKSFALDPRTAVDGQWLLGRRRGLAISLDYDPYVSLENSVVRVEQGRVVIEDLPESKNGTSVNWEPLAKGKPRALQPAESSVSAWAARCWSSPSSRDHQPFGWQGPS